MESYLDSEIDNILKGRSSNSPTYRRGGGGGGGGADDSPLAVQRLMQDAERLSTALKAKNRYFGGAAGGGGRDLDSSPAALRVTVNDVELRLSTISSTISKMLKEIENLAKELLEFQTWRASRAQADDDDDRELRELSARVAEQQHAREALSASVRTLEARVQNSVSHADLGSILEVQRGLKKELRGFLRHEDVAPLEKMLGECVNQGDFTHAIARLKSVVMKEIHTTLDDNLATALDTQDKDLRAAIRLELRKLEARLEDSIHEQVTSSRNAIASSTRSPVDRAGAGVVHDLREDLADVQAEMKSMRQRMEAQDEVIDGLLSKCDLLAEDNRRLRNLRVRIVEESAELKNVKDAVIDQDDKLERLTADMQAVLGSRATRGNGTRSSGSSSSKSIVRAPSPIPRPASHRSPSPLMHGSRPSSRSPSPAALGSSQSGDRRGSGGGITVPQLSPGSAAGMDEYDRDPFSSRQERGLAHNFGSRPRNIGLPQSQSRSPVGAGPLANEPRSPSEQGAAHFARRGALQQHEQPHRYSGQRAAPSSAGGPGGAGALHPLRFQRARADATPRIHAKSPNRNGHSVSFADAGRPSPGPVRATARSPTRYSSPRQHRGSPDTKPSASARSPGVAAAKGGNYWSTDAVRHLSISQFESSVDSDTTL